jgi:hypothetical protein
MKRWLAISILLGVAGCDSGALETGYYPHKLGDSPSARQAYYAAPFSPEAANQPANPHAGPDMGMRQPTRY